jgi:hypothetical protein
MQWPLSGVHSIMTVNSAQPDEGGGVQRNPYHPYGSEIYTKQSINEENLSFFMISIL